MQPNPKSHSCSTFALALLIAMAALTGCGGRPPYAAPQAPVFSSTPVTAALEGSAYSYQLAATSPSDSSVSYTLTSAPAGATLAGDTISWTPTSAQSRIANTFSVLATSAEGGSATQSWTVTPSGTVHLTRIDTYWTLDGSTLTPFDWSRVASRISAQVQQPDGSFVSLTGSTDGIGLFNIPNVPGGYYWLRVSAVDNYWTSASQIDLSADYFFRTIGPAVAPSTTSIDLEFSGLDPTPQSTFELLSMESPLLTSWGFVFPSGNSISRHMQFNGNVGFSNLKHAFALEYLPAALGTGSGYVLGPELTLSNLAIVDGTSSTISGALNPVVPATANLNLKGSAWAPLFDHVAAVPLTGSAGNFSVTVQPFATSHVIATANDISLIFDRSDGLLTAIPGATTPCENSFSTFSTAPATSSGLLGDIDPGTVNYSDPFPAEWLRKFNTCQYSTIAVPVPGSNSTQTLQVSIGQSTAQPTSAITPLLSPVRDPKINGSDLFTPAQLNNGNVTLSWTAPLIGAPTGYRVRVATPFTGPTPPSGTTPQPLYVSSYTLTTTKTTLVIPPSVLIPGNAYLFLITAVVDGAADFQSAPHKSALPIANADVISAPMTVAAP